MGLKRHCALTSSVLILLGSLFSVPAVSADEGSNLPTSGVTGKSTIDGSVRSSARAHGSNVDVGVRAEGGSGGAIEITAPASSGAAPSSSSGVQLSPEEIRQQQMELRQYATGLYRDDALERPPAVEQANYSVVDTCANAPDQEACQEQEACTMADGGTGQNYYVEYSLEDGGADTQRVSRPLCLPAGEVPESGSMPIPVFTVEDLQRLDIAAAVSIVEPAPHTLVNYNTNVYAEATAQEFTTTLADYPVTVRVYPIEYTWDYGDGTTLGPTQLTGYPLAEDQWDTPTDTSHRYTDTGDVQVTLSTTFEGEYSVAGGPWLAVDGTSTVTSAPVELSVWRAKVRNYADDCIENPNGTGC